VPLGAFAGVIVVVIAAAANETDTAANSIASVVMIPKRRIC
jgi:hypothetical protein